MSELVFDFGEKPRKYIAIGDEFHDVEDYHPGITSLEKGIGYIYDGYVFIYRGKKSKFEGEELEPGIYSLSKGRFKFVYPETKSDMEDYSESKVMTMNTEAMFDEVASNKNRFIDAEDIEMIEKNSPIFRPTLSDEDDFLKWAIKKTIIEKGGITLRSYKDKVVNQFDLNNLKGVVENKTKMTPYKFNDWCNLIGLRWTLTIEDDGTDDKSRPLTGPIVLESEDFQ